MDGVGDPTRPLSEEGREVEKTDAEADPNGQPNPGPPGAASLEQLILAEQRTVGEIRGRHMTR